MASPADQRHADLAARLEVVDMHHHVGSWRSFGGAGDAGPLLPEEEAALRERLLDDMQVDLAVLLPSVHHDGTPAAVRRANDEVIAQRERSSRVARGSFTLPIPDVEACLAEIERAVDRGLWGATFHHRFAGLVIDHASMWPLLRELERRACPVLVHCLAESTLEAVWRLERLAEAFPGLPFLALDALSSPSAAQEVLQVARRRPNVFFDTAVLCPVPSPIATFCEAVGADRLLYGSDLYVDPPTYHFPGALFEILAAPVSEGDKRSILGGNARRLLLGEG